MKTPLSRLGNSGLETSLLGLGTVKFGRNAGVKYPSAFELPDDKSLTSLLSLATDLGINVLDTAPAYGSSEERLGQLLKGQRHDWIISTKTGETFDGKNSAFDFSAEATRQSVERSLKRLKTDYLDIVMVHSDGNDLELIERYEVIPTLDQLKQEGKIRQTGFSGKTLEGALAALQQVDMLMLTYNLREHREGEAIDQANHLGKGVYIKKAFASGHLVSGSGEEGQLSSFRHILGKAGISSIIVGTINPDHLKQNVRALCQASAGMVKPAGL